MADTKREIERKFEFTTGKAARRGVPDLTGTDAIASVADQGTVDLDAVYYDTPDHRLAADGLTLRRRFSSSGSGDLSAAYRPARAALSHACAAACAVFSRIGSGVLSRTRWAARAALSRI
ncbi:CYTH domain-containing protein [Streptomyces roseus]|uniref:CYTH domain-containing protein n=1 Tax=Streptomyces roseus TaxID=66430 RepID=UPI003F4CD8D0